MNHELMGKAADWFDRQNELQPAEQEEFAHWLEHPEHSDAYLRISRAMGSPELNIALSNKQKSVEVHSNVQAAKENNVKSSLLRLPCAHKKATPSVFIFTNWKSLAAGFACFGSILIWHLSELHQPPTSPIIAVTKTYPVSAANYMAGVGSRESKLLADGTMIHLNANSQLQVDQQSNERHAVLSQGQVYFSVAPDKHRPFKIDAGLAQIEVVGTEFDVDRLTDRLVVSVYEGHVRIRAAEVYDLFKGQKITLIDGQPPRLIDVNLSMLPDWRSGWLDISQQPLATVLEKLQRYLPKMIVLDPSVASDLSINGRFTLDHPQKALRLLAKANQLVIEELDDKIQLRAL